MVTAFCFLGFGVWAVQTRTGLVFEIDPYWKQMLDNSPFLSKNIGPDGRYMPECQIMESGTLKGLRKQKVTSGPFLAEQIVETWHGPCYVEVQVGNDRKIIWGRKLVKSENMLFHSVHVTIE